MMDNTAPTLRRVGDNTAHEFFGYYNKSNWDREDRLMLAHRVAERTGDLDGSQSAQVGYFDLSNDDRFHSVSETTTWNWQMGAQLQWLPGLEGRKLVFNDRAKGSGRAVNDGFRATIVDIDTGQARHLPHPVYSAAPSSEWALTVNYSRLLHTHQTIGYHRLDGEPKLQLCPKDDGLFLMNVATGAVHLVVSLHDLATTDRRPSMEKAIHWISHCEINSASSRVLFLHRWTERVLDETCFLHRLITCNPDGGDLRILECTDHPLPQLGHDFDPDAVGTFDYERSEYQISHPMWAGDQQIIVWGPHEGRIGYHLYNEASGQVSQIGLGELDENGHMTFSPSGRWLLSDTYPDPDTHIRELFLWHMQNGQKITLGSFQTDPELGKHNRCDLHPRWSNDGSMISFDSVHEGARGLYVFDLQKLNY